MTSQDLIVIEQNDYMPAMSIQQAAQRFNTLVEFVQTVMRPDIDYGVIPGTGTKPTLLKPGAEKLTTLFGLSTRFIVVEKTEDWTGDEHGGEPFFYYWYRCQLWRGERLIAEADGSCNSREAKYRWREAKRSCPKCGAAAINRSKYPPRKNPDAEPGWYCFAKQGGCGVEFAADDPTITGQQTGRTPNPDICDQINTMQKMSQKRALIAATLIGVNASEFFTQDVEDIALAGNGSSYSPPVQVVNTSTGEITNAPTPDDLTDYRNKLVLQYRETVKEARGRGITVPQVTTKEWTIDQLSTAIHEIEAKMKLADASWDAEYDAVEATANG